MKRRPLSRIAVLLLLVLAIAPSLHAQTTKPASAYDGQSVARGKAVAPATPREGIDMGRLAMALIVVVGLIVALKYAAGWLFPHTRAGNSTRGVRVLGRTPMGPRQQVVLLHVGRRVLVVGDSAGTLCALASIEGADEVAEVLGATSGPNEAATPGRFRSLFGQAKDEYALPMPHGGHADEGTPDQDESSPEVTAAKDEIAGLLERMRTITKAARR